MIQRGLRSAGLVAGETTAGAGAAAAAAAPAAPLRLGF